MYPSLVDILFSPMSSLSAHLLPLYESISGALAPRISSCLDSSSPKDLLSIWYHVLLLGRWLKVEGIFYVLD
jgi:hypothetical protein